MKQLKRNSILAFILLCASLTIAQTSYQIDVSQVSSVVKRGHLDLGGSNAKGDSIAVNSFYIERKGQPYIPVIGEFHYSRYPHQYWEEEIKKMKAGGITVVATYVFWNMHEFKEGRFDWTGDLNVREFTELCAQNGMDVIMRMSQMQRYLELNRK